MTEEKRRRVRYAPHPDPARRRRGEKVKALALGFKVIEEHWSVYELEDGTRVRIRASIGGFDKPLDPETGEVMFRDDGTPLYGMQVGVEVSYECPEELVKKVQ